MDSLSKPVSLHSYNAPMASKHSDDGIIAILHTGSQTMVIKGAAPDDKARPLWTADTAHIKAICALMYTGRDDEALHNMHVAVVRKMMEHMGKRADDTMMTVRALNVMLAEAHCALTQAQRDVAEAQRALAQSQYLHTETQRALAESQRNVAESQRVQAALSARVAKLETSSDAQFDWAEM